MRDFKFRVWDAKSKNMGSQGIGIGYDQVMTYARLTTLGDNVLMQYTGLNDKDGFEIYEGDILATDNDGSDGADKWNTETMGAISWDNQYACFIGLPDDDDDSIYSLQYVKVVGNIYESPELLTKENNQ